MAHRITSCVSFPRLLLCLLACLVYWNAWAAPGTLSDFLPAVTATELMPGADRLGPIEPGKPPVARLYAGDQHKGYAYLTSDIVNTTGYSSKPIHIIVGMALDGQITGAKLVKHDEPIVLIGIPQARIDEFIHGYVGLNFVKNPPRGRAKPPVDIISGVTVTLMVIGDNITRSSMAVARAQGIGQPAGAAQAAAAPPADIRRINPDLTDVQPWDVLLGNGAVRHMRLTVGQIDQAFAQNGDTQAAQRSESDDPADTFIDLYAALVSAPAIGRSLLGDAVWQHLQKRLKPGQQAILVAGDGAYSFKGSGYVRGGIFDRIEIIQGDNSFRFRDRHHQRLGDIAAHGAPHFPEIALFVVPEEASFFDPVANWDLQLLVQRTFGINDKAFLTFDLGYQLPDAFLTIEAAPAAASPAQPAATADSTAADAGLLDEPEQALWKHMWQAKTVQIAVLAVALLILTCVFFFQNWFARHPVFYDRFRLAYLSFTLFWLGGYCVAQLSVVNVLTFTSSLRTGFSWEYFLMDPIVFILWCATAVSSLLWNRGAFCGWLCPFGAMQELANRLARVLHIRQLKIAFGVHERLSVLKYIIFLGLFALSLHDLGTAEKFAEVEPFKTAIILKFLREWPFVIFAVSLLIASLFIERFYCRYLCPLGAALAIPSRLRLFDWLRRYKECGNPCQRCAIECPVQAIHPEGHISPNECIQCLNCQVLYHHNTKCPHLIQKNARLSKRKEAPTEASSDAPARVRKPTVRLESMTAAQPTPAARDTSC